MGKIILIFVSIIASGLPAFADEFECSDYFGHTKFNVNYIRVAPENVWIKGTFKLQSDTAQSVSGSFSNYPQEPGLFTLNNFDCSRLKQEGFCTNEFGRWHPIGRGQYTVNFGGINSVVACQGEVP